MSRYTDEAGGALGASIEHAMWHSTSSIISPIISAPARAAASSAATLRR